MIEDKVAIVTGGTYGIGLAITLRLAEAGWRVVAFGLDARQPGSSAEGGSALTAAELRRRGLVADVLEGDVSDPAHVERIVDFAVDRYGRVDGLVNNAGVHIYGDIRETTKATWDKTLAVNLTGIFLATKSVVPLMVQAGSGAIVNMGSASGWGRPNLLAYSASKGGVFGISSALAHDLRPEGIRVNVVVPGGWVSTGMTNSDSKPPSVPGPVAGRPVVGEDIAHAVNFLLSEEAEQITGAILNVGGSIMQAGG